MKQTEFKRRRRQLMQMMGPGSVAILPAAPEVVRNRDVHYPYRPDSDFYYLTGFSEPEAIAVLIPGRRQAEYVLFCRERDEKRERWDGPRAGQEKAVQEFGADDSFPIADCEEILPGLLEECTRVFYAMGSNPDLDKRLADWVNQIRGKARTGVHGPVEFIALDHYLHEMRLYKSAAEVQRMRQAAKITSAAHVRLMQTCRPGMHEYELEAEFIHECATRGARFQAYPSIVGGGGNACVLHYVDNRDELKDGDLVLVDAGCEYGYYASDITRTFPVNGRFNPAQRAIYELVLAAQEAAIAKVKLGNHWNDPHDAAVRVITKGLIDLGLLKGTPTHVIKEQAYAKFYMHRTGHWLGMDVHDVGDYYADGKSRALVPGMVLTIEPGVYVAQDDEAAPKEMRGVGIRIEDDVLVTESGHENLTAGVPKEVAEVEAVCVR